MNEKTEGSEKPFYENIVSQHKRTAKPPKAGKEGSENAGHSGYVGRPSAPSDSRPRGRAERPGSNVRFQRPDGSAPRSEIRGDNRPPRGDGRGPGDGRFPRGDGNASRGGGYAPRGDENRGARGDSRTVRADSHGLGDNRFPRNDGYAARGGDNRGARFDGRGAADSRRPGAAGRPSIDNRGPRTDSHGSGDGRRPRYDNNAPRADNRGPGENRFPRNDNYAPRGDNRSAPRGRYPKPEVRHATDEERTFAQNEAAREGESGFTRPVSHMEATREAERNFARNESGLGPDGIAPRSESRAPRSNGFAPRGDGRSPHGGSRAPRTDGYAPRSDSRAPRNEGRPAYGDARAPRGDGRTARGDGRAPRSESRSPRSDSRTPRDEGSHPHEGTRAPRKPFQAPVSFAPVFGELPASVRKLLDSFPEIVDAVFPLDSKKLLSLPSDIRELSHDLTDERADRRVGYMNDPAVLSAYIRYYMWWNLVRLCRLLVSLPINLKDGDAAVDLGSGPLTLPIALWMTRPELRAKKITWYCVDISQGALAAGEELFLSLAARTGDEPWQITRVKGECGVSLRRRVALVTSANMFNELFWDNPLPLEQQAKHYAEEISSYAESESSILVIEPGVPRAGRFISLIRDSLIRLDYKPVSPCPHDGPCPFPGLRHGKWCHFVFDTSDAPAKLHKLSDEAGLAKDRAALSFIYSRRTAALVEGEAQDAAAGTDGAIATAPQAASEIVSRISGLFPDLKVRVTSDPIKLPDYYTGRYGCSERGMIMLTGTYQAADYLQTCHSGSMVAVPMPDRKQPEIDAKTDAIIVRLK